MPGLGFGFTPAFMHRRSAVAPGDPNTLTVLDGNGASFTVPATVLDSDGNPFNVS
jgi:hypothetical protein